MEKREHELLPSSLATPQEIVYSPSMANMNRRRFTVAALASSAGLFSGCGQQQSSPAASSTPVSTPNDPQSSGPVLPFGLTHFLVTGQSLACGILGGPILSTSQTLGNLMFNIGPRLVPDALTFTVVNPATDLASLIPLVEYGIPVAGETCCSGFANRLGYIQNASTRTPALMSVNAVGGAAYELIKQGTVPYANGIASVVAGKKLASGGFSSYGVGAVIVVHGETDEAAQNVNYAANLLEWITDYNNDILPITGQTAQIPMIQSQMASGWSDSFGVSNGIPQRQLDAAEANPGVIALACPKYMLSYYGGTVHLDGYGYRWLGEYCARAYETMLGGKQWRPVSPKSIAFTSSTRNALIVDFWVPTAPLVFDTVLVNEPTGIPGQKYGFEIFDTSAQPPAITSVTPYGSSGTTLLIQLASALGSGARLRYAYSLPNPGGVAGPQPPSGGCRGNLRDSDPTVSQYGNTLYNWCVTFDKAL